MADTEQKANQLFEEAKKKSVGGSGGFMSLFRYVKSKRLYALFFNFNLIMIKILI